MNKNDNVVRYQKKAKKTTTNVKKTNPTPVVDQALKMEATKELDINKEVLASDALLVPDFTSTPTVQKESKVATLPPESSQGGPMGKKDKKKTKKNRSVLLNIITGFSALFLTGFLVVAIFVGTTIVKADPLTIESFENSDSTVILDANDNVIYDLGVKLIENVEYEDLSQSVIDAFVAIEDSRFFEHNGVDTPRFTTAIFKNVLDSLRERSLSFDAGGASTIDMQLTKNSLFMYEDVETGESNLPASSGLAGIQRKILEIYYSSKINSSKLLSKKVILQKYVNLANFGVGNNSLGIQMAANYYFDKTVSELNLVESAFLAGVVNRPNRITPYYRLSNAKERTETVLYYMNYHGYISDHEYQLALSVPLENLFVDQTERKGDALPNQAYIDVVLNEVKELTNLNPATTPMIIKTSMNANLQKQLDKVQNREINDLNVSANTKSYLQMASTVLDNETGEIIGIVGGYDYYGQRVYNRSSQANYQPGSTIKPFISYAPAFEYLGYSTKHVIRDEPYYWGGTNIAVNNFNNRYKGDVLLEDAVADSLNIPAIKTFDEVNSKIGMEKYRDYVESIGFTRYAEINGKESMNSQFAIGGSDFYTNTQELAGAAATMLNGGTYIKPHTIREIVLKNTQEVIESPYKATPVLSDGAAFLTADIMRSVAEKTPIMANMRRDYPLYGKTGTTNWGKEGPKYGNPVGSSKDRLLITGTNRFSMATWTGFDADDVKNPKATTYFRPLETNFRLHSRLNKFILDIVESEYGKGKAIAQPSSVQEINYILGTFPYAKPISGMNDAMITKGLIKKEAAALVDYTNPSVDNLASMTHEVTQSMGHYKVNVNFAPYPDLTKLEVASSTLIMVDRAGKQFTGRRLFDPTWIYGAIVYRADIYAGDNIVKSLSSNTELLEIDINTPNSNDLKVCGYYTFDLNHDVKSNSICQPINLSNVTETVRVPGFEGSSAEHGIEQLNAFANRYGITVNLNRVSAPLSSYGKIVSINPDHRNQSMPLPQLPKNWTVTFNDTTINTSNYVTTNDLRQQLGAYVNIAGGDGIIQTIKDSQGKTLTNFSLYDYYKKTLYVTTK